MKKTGFTLAEVLITLGILGIIAALTLPALNTNTQKHQACTTLAKAINVIRNTNDLALEQSGTRTLDDMLRANNQGVDQYFNFIMRKYMDYEYPERTKKYFKPNGSPHPKINAKTNYYHTKDGISYFRAPTSSVNSIGSTSHLSRGYSGKYYDVYVDVNGHNKAPNTVGKDVFRLIIDTKGVVIPYGGFAYKTYTGSAGDVLWKAQCNATTVTDGDACAGAIVDNNYKIRYKY